MFVHHVHACLWRPTEGAESPGTAVTDGYEQPRGCTEGNPNLLEEKPMLLTAGPALQLSSSQTFMEGKGTIAQMKVTANPELWKKESCREKQVSAALHICSESHSETYGKDKSPRVWFTVPPGGGRAALSS